MASGYERCLLGNSTRKRYDTREQAAQIDVHVLGLAYTSGII